MTAKGAIVVTFDEAEAARLYEDGESLKGLARRYGVSAPTIKKRLVNRGVKMRKGFVKPRKVDWDAIVAAYEDGDSIHDIAYQYKMGTKTVSRNLKKRGVEIQMGPRNTRLKPERPRCKRCEIVLDEVAYHKDGVCCICLALQYDQPLGSWVWAAAD